MFSYKICRVENNEQCLYAETINHIMVYFLYLVRMAVFYALKLESSAEDMLILWQYLFIQQEKWHSR